MVGEVIDIILLLIKGYLEGRYYNMLVYIAFYFKRVCDLYLFCYFREFYRDYYFID